MKKRLLSLLLTAVMALGLTACGGGSGTDHMTVTIEGNKYDLSGDFQKAVGAIAKDDIHVVSTMGQFEFDENGYFQKYDMAAVREGKAIFAMEQLQIGVINDEPVREVVGQYYELSTGNAEYKTADGITNESDADDAAALKGYVAQQGFRTLRNEAYAGFYVDGKIVDLKEYKDEYEKILADVEDGAVSSEIMSEYFYGISMFLDTRFAKSNMSMVVFSDLQQAMDSDDMSSFEEQYPCFEEDMLLALAAMDAGEKLLDGDIESYTMIIYEYNEGDAMWTYFYDYHRDKDYDIHKFDKK